VPRKARIDAPGVLHHIMVHGIDRRRIFSDDQDRLNFLDRSGDIVTETNTGPSHPKLFFSFITAYEG
jgi:REP-associated tyrosine transposase